MEKGYHKEVNRFWLMFVYHMVFLLAGIRATVLYLAGWDLPYVLFVASISLWFCYLGIKESYMVVVISLNKFRKIAQGTEG